MVFKIVVAIGLMLAPGVCLSEERFSDTRSRAMQGDFGAQRETADCLKTGKCGVFVRKPIEACAWRMVIVASRHPEVETSDVSNQRLDCGSARLANLDRAIALQEAEELFRRIYHRELPLDALAVR